MKDTRHFLPVVIAGVFAVFFTGCYRTSRPSAPELPPSVPEVPSPAAAAPVTAWQALAVLKTGAYPLWFEFSGEAGGSPRLIPSPAEASLSDYAPWPHARFCAGILVSGTDLVLAINREGFLIVSPGEESGGAVLYRAADPAWNPYTIASVFVYEEKPAVLLYRDDFFAPLTAPAPEQPVKILSKDHRIPPGVPVPAFDVLPQDEGWEINALRRGSDGRWYYRFVQTGRPQPGTAYYRTADLSAKGERTGLEDYRNSARPENTSNAPSFLAPLITAAAALPGIPVLRIISPELSGERLFSPSPSAEEDFFQFFGYYSTGETENLAFALMPNGNGLALKDGSVFSFTLPALPEGFVYTGTGLAGNILIASWEEQEDSAIGAAGFMALNAETLGLFGN